MHAQDIWRQTCSFIRLDQRFREFLFNKMGGLKIREIRFYVTFDIAGKFSYRYLIWKIINSNMARLFLKWNFIIRVDIKQHPFFTRYETFISNIEKIKIHVPISCLLNNKPYHIIFNGMYIMKFDQAIKKICKTKKRYWEKLFEIQLWLKQI